MKPKKTTLKDYLIDILPEENINLVNRSFEIVGSIAIVEIPEELDVFSSQIGEALLKVNSSIKTVLKKSGFHHGEFRTQDLKYVAGINTKETIYLENGISLILNPETVYFSARLSTERAELMNNLKEGQRVLVMFSGVGPYSFVGLKKQPNISSMTSIELNPQGTKYSLESLELNKNILKKSKIFQDLLVFLRENKFPIVEKELIRKLNFLKIHFINGDVNKEIENFNLEKTTSLKEDSALFDLDIKKTFSNLINRDRNEISLDLDSMSLEEKEQLKYFLIYFADKFSFKICINSNWYFLDSFYKKGLLLEYLQYKFNCKDLVSFDEIFMPLPKDACLFLDSAFKVAKSGSIIHMYDFVKVEDFPIKTKNAITAAAKKFGIKVEILSTRKVGQYSPKKFRVCCDFKVL